MTKTIEYVRIVWDNTLWFYCHKNIVFAKKNSVSQQLKNYVYITIVDNWLHICCINIDSNYDTSGEIWILCGCKEESHYHQPFREICITIKWKSYHIIR